jgi:hypothetical protein
LSDRKPTLFTAFTTGKDQRSGIELALLEQLGFIMLLDGVPLKVKLVGIAVLALLIFSLVGAALEAVNQAAYGDASDSWPTRNGFTGQTSGESAGSDDQTVVGTLKFICPFH